MDIGAWIGVSSLVLSAALGYNGYRTTRVNALEKRIDELEDAHRQCESDVRRLRSDNDWLMEQLRSLRRNPQ